jgi:hypothetical protein
MMTRALAVALAFSLAGCAAEVDTSDLPDISDYRSWPSFEVSGELPGHGDTVREIFVNDLAQSWSGAGEYPLGTVIIKDVYERKGSERGSLSYIAVMRKLDQSQVPGGGELQGGWLFTMLADEDSAEANNLRCYETCHVAAPNDSSFFDFGL